MGTVACGAVKPASPGIGRSSEWVADRVRGLGIGRRVLEALEAQARELGMTDTSARDHIRRWRRPFVCTEAPLSEVPASAPILRPPWFEKRLP